MGLGRKFAKQKGHEEEDFELNIASIIDCFTVLITYLLFTASFLSLGVIDVSAVTNGNGDGTVPPMSLAIGLDQGRLVKIKVSGKENLNLTIPAKDAHWDLEALTEKLTALKEKWPDLKDAVLGADADVEYSDIVKALEAVRKTLPNIALADMQQT